MTANQLTDLSGLVGPALETLNLTGWAVGFHGSIGGVFCDIMRVIDPEERSINLGIGNFPYHFKCREVKTRYVN